MKLTPETVTKTVSVIGAFIDTATIKVKRNPTDFWADRLRIAATQRSLIETLNEFGMQLRSSSLSSGELKNMLLAGKAQDAGAVQRWLGDLPRIPVTLAREQNKDELPMLIDAVCQSYEAIEIDQNNHVKPRPKFHVGIKATVLEALAHGADTKSGNATPFRRAKVFGGAELPYYSANAIGGMMRDYLADHFTESLGFKPSRSAPVWDDWFFHLLYSGGIMQDGYIPKEFERILTGAASGTIRSDGVRQLRDMLPFFSMLGGVGKHPIESYVSINDLRPNCIEWGTGDKSVFEMFDWRYLARRDDNENRTSKAQKEEGEVAEGSENTSMLANTEVLRENVVLEGGFFLSNHISDIEKAAFCKGLELIQQMPFLGGKKNRSFGLCEIEYSINKKDLTLDSKPYDDYLSANKEAIISYLKSIGAFVKPEKTKKEKRVEAEIS
jgi:hypothetical protein